MSMRKIKTPFDNQYDTISPKHWKLYEEVELKKELLEKLENYCDWIFPRRDNKETRFDDINPSLQTLMEELNKDLCEKKLLKSELWTQKMELEEKIRKFQFVGTNLKRNTPHWCSKQDIIEHKEILKQFKIKEYQYRDETSKN